MELTIPPIPDMEAAKFPLHGSSFVQYASSSGGGYTEFHFALKPQLTKRATSCTCGGGEAWFGATPTGSEICLGCTCHTTEKEAAENLFRYLQKEGLKRQFGTPDQRRERILA